MRSNFYTVFVKDLEQDPVLAKEYTDATRGQKAGIRKRHFETKGHIAQEKKAALFRHEQVDRIEGEWLTPKQLYQTLGCDLPATLSWIESCLDLGASQYKLNVVNL